MLFTIEAIIWYSSLYGSILITHDYILKQDIDLYHTCMHDYACMCAFENGGLGTSPLFVQY